MDPLYVSYQDDFGVWKYVEGELRSHLPLRGLILRPSKHGNTPNQPRLIDQMDITLLPFDDERLQFSNTVANFYRKPYLHLYIVHCDDSDCYKHLVKAKIKSWVQMMTEKQQEWLIVYVSLGHRRTLTDITTKLQRTVYDKIRADFNPTGPSVPGVTSKRDRCCQLRLLDPQQEQDHWDDFLMKMKEGISATVEQYISAYDEEIRKVEARRTNAQQGWSYSNYFFLRESLAFVLERAHMFDDALYQYFELEKMYKDYNVRFEKFGGTDSGDDNFNLLALDFSKKPYREILYNNSISEFDFRQYLFARKVRLFVHMRKPTDVINAAVSFIASMSASLEARKDSLPPLFCESWVFSSCIAIADHFESSKSNSNSPNLNLLPNSIHALHPSISAPSLTAVGASNSFSSAIPNPPKMPKQLTPPLPRILQRNGTTPTGTFSNTNSASVTQAQLTSQPINLTNSGPMNNNSTVISSNGAEKHEKDVIDSLLADLLYHARTKMDKLGVAVGLLGSNSETEKLKRKIPTSRSWVNGQTNNLEGFNITVTPDPATAPASLSVETNNATQSTQNSNSTSPNLHPAKPKNSEFPSVTNPSLHLALQSEAEFDKLYLALTFKAAQLYTDSGRFRSVVRLNREIADIYYLRSVFDKAESLLKSVATTYYSDGWHELEYSARVKLADCQRQLGRSVEYVTTCLMLLNPEIPLKPDEKIFYMEQFTTLASNPLPSLVQKELQPIFQATLLPPSKDQSFRAGQSIPLFCIITSTLPKEIFSSKLSVRMVAQNSNEESTVFEASDIVIKPGENKITIFAEPQLQGTFIWEKLSLEFGSVVLSHVLRTDNDFNWQVQILEPQSTVVLEPLVPPTLVLGEIQSIELRIHTQNDPIEAGSLRLWSPTGLTILDIPQTSIVKRDKEGVHQMIATTFLGGRVTFGNINANETLFVYIPIKSNIEHEGLIHQLRGELYHERKQKGKFVVSTSMELIFVHPLSFTPTVVSMPSSLGLFVQALLKSNAHCGIQVVGFQLNGLEKSGLFIKVDPNYSAKGSMILPSQQLSLVYHLGCFPDQIRTHILELIVQYKLIWKPSGHSTLHDEVTTFMPSVYSFTSQIPISTPQQLYKIDLTYPQDSSVGTAILLEIVVTRLQIESVDTQTPENSSKESNVQYELDVDQNVWMLSGPKKLSFTLTFGESKGFRCRMIPISPGYLPVPRVKLHGVDPTKVIEPPSSKQIHVYPKASITSSCIVKNLAT
eukprot:TRINITY_DN1057_c0_g4_i1.p1 TRINITY_DN1057_c0_g4~~TRINITY_DN1057_c0_g4_i1.p1  ORF type:complete len:1237 (+),score=216.75 TRINITY_DN1057_c0_g4_i1:464-4174(+)